MQTFGDTVGRGDSVVAECLELPRSTVFLRVSGTLDHGSVFLKNITRGQVPSFSDRMFRKQKDRIPTENRLCRKEVEALIASRFRDLIQRSWTLQCTVTARNDPLP